MNESIDKMVAQYEKGKDLRYTSLLRLLSAFDISLQEFFAEGFN